MNKKYDGSNLLTNEMPIILSKDRLDFGHYQIKDMGEIEVGMKMAICYGGKNKNGQVVRLFVKNVEIIKAPYEVFPGSWLIDVKTININCFFHHQKESIFLEDVGVNQYKNGSWNTVCWMEHYHEKSIDIISMHYRN